MTHPISVLPALVRAHYAPGGLVQPLPHIERPSQRLAAISPPDCLPKTSALAAHRPLHPTHFVRDLQKLGLSVEAKYESANQFFVIRQNQHFPDAHDQKRFGLVMAQYNARGVGPLLFTPALEHNGHMKRNSLFDLVDREVWPRRYVLELTGNVLRQAQIIQGNEHYYLFLDAAKGPVLSLVAIVKQGGPDSISKDRAWMQFEYDYHISTQNLILVEQWGYVEWAGIREPIPHFPMPLHPIQIPSIFSNSSQTVTNS